MKEDDLQVERLQSLMIAIISRANFPYTSFVHCPREANSVANELANLAKGPSCTNFFFEPPRELIPLLLCDVTLIEL